ncbi:Ornithine carbamoyltransferase [Olavius algarvensis spirochete endosymbiont]|uniref:knotted carbamoyltransferase YgeW n=1 Tax=Olavius algarvensis spirochete endosymbiont TaxID=260710 RepID=UPI00052C7D9D|nr:knotted carbamoyltransferase YgeW [Olavius algarvensis spirochete endosymbiont]KGM38680.1 ornithine carbamoyltransferase [Alkalispirochaeta odontotermitis]CAD7839598.1 MAG: Aspartate/ornithine carbamoyltransferase family protein protein YgeW [Olavius algarvensis spirochete endosymbiont]VDA99935.1 Ornithine carbamoyltransferase [Olavius algarvensis spirochete endosymbiont]
MDKNLSTAISELAELETQAMYQKDFLLSWEKSDEGIRSVFKIAQTLRAFRKRNISAKLFDSGLAISLFRDNSTRTRFSYASAANMLGLEVQDLDESKSQIVHGETVRETANMISFMADVIGIRDDMYIGKGNAYMREMAKAVEEGYRDGILEQRPTLVNLQCDMDHPTQSMADALHLIEYFGGIEKLRGKKIAMTWAYSPSYGKPLSVPQGIIALFTRLGMEVHLAHPDGYEVMAEVEQIATKNAADGEGSFTKSNSMAAAFEGAHIVYPKSWAPYSAMKRRTELYAENDSAGIKALEKELLGQNAEHRDWECNKALMAKTQKALYMHCLPADISGVSCARGEVTPQVFDEHRAALYKEASYKPYIIAAMILVSKFPKPAETLEELLSTARPKIR